MKKIICVMLALVMVLGMVASAYALPLVEYPLIGVKNLNLVDIDPETGHHQFRAAGDFFNISKALHDDVVDVVKDHVELIKRDPEATLANAEAKEYVKSAYAETAAAIKELTDDVELESSEVVLFSKTLVGHYTPFLTATEGETIFVKAQWISTDAEEFGKLPERLVSVTDAKFDIDVLKETVAYQKAVHEGSKEAIPEEVAKAAIVRTLQFFGLDGITLTQVTPSIDGVSAVYMFKMPGRMVTGYDFKSKAVDTKTIENKTAEIVYVVAKAEEDFIGAAVKVLLPGEKALINIPAKYDVEETFTVEAYQFNHTYGYVAVNAALDGEAIVITELQ